MKSVAWRGSGSERVDRADAHPANVRVTRLCGDTGWSQVLAPPSTTTPPRMHRPVRLRTLAALLLAEACSSPAPAPAPAPAPVAAPARVRLSVVDETSAGSFQAMRMPSVPFASTVKSAPA